MSRADSRIKLSVDSKIAFFTVVILSLFCFLGLGLINASDGWAQDVTLEWDPNTEPDLGGYIVHYGTQSGIYDYSLDVGNFNSAVISGLEPDTEYYFAVSAYNLDGLSSALSNEVSSALVPSTTFASNSGGGGGGGCFISAAKDASARNSSNSLLRQFRFIWQRIGKLTESFNH